MEEIHFSSTGTLESYRDKKWSVGESYNVEFFSGKLVPVFLFDTNSDLEEPLNKMSNDQIIFCNFEYVPKNIKAPAICLFSFCCSSGVFIFKQVNNTPNTQIKNFLLKQNRKLFIGFKIAEIFQRLKILFGDNFFMNYDDAVKSRIPPRESHDLRLIILKYAGTPNTDFIDFNSKWNEPVLTIKQVLTTAFSVYAFSLCYPRLPQNKPLTKLIKRGNIQFENGGIPKRIPKTFKIGDFYQVEFFSGVFTPVYLLDANSNIDKYIKILSKDPIIFSDFEYVPFDVDQANLIPINLFSFFCSSGVFIFQETEIKGNSQLGQFLRKKEGQKFYTFGCLPIKSKLKKMFGDDFTIDIDDLYRTRVPKGNSKKKALNNFILQYGGQPLIKSKIVKAKRTFWSRRILTTEQILYSSYVVVGLSKCYQNLPPIINEEEEEVSDEDIDSKYDKGDDRDVAEEEGQNLNYGQIQFNEKTPLSSFKSSDWSVGATAEIEFFPGTFSKVYLLDAEKDIERFIPQISKDDVIFIDFEYVPLFKRDAAPVCLFQFCSSEGAFLFRQRTTKKNVAMKKFLSKENGLHFIAKGIGGDMARLKKFFGDDFDMNIEDVEQTRLKTYNESLNFEKMVEKFAGKPSAQFKDKKISCSNWNARKLSKIQVIYSAFDVVALYACYPHYHPIKLSSYAPPPKEAIEPQEDVKERLIKYAVSNKKFDSKDLNDSEKVDEFWKLNPNLVFEMIHADVHLYKESIYSSLTISNKNTLRCKKCRKSSFQFFSSFLGHYKSNHFKKSMKSANEKVDVKELFVHYLSCTGRIYLINFLCCLCNKTFKSLNEIAEHCWTEHCQLLNEFTMTRKKEEDIDDESEEEEDEEESDNDDDSDDDD